MPTNKEFIALYLYCFCISPVKFSKYQLYCTIHNKNIDINLLLKIVYLKSLKI